MIKIKSRSTFLITLSDLFVNLSAGWFGAAIVVPALLDKPLTFNLWLVILDFVFGIIFFSFSYKLKRLARRKGFYD